MKYSIKTILWIFIILLSVSVFSQAGATNSEGSSYVTAESFCKMGDVDGKDAFSIPKGYKKQGILQFFSVFEDL